MSKDFLSEMPESKYGFLFHYYRAEVYRETNWRNRLDVTTNWAIVVSAAMLSYAFSNPSVPHSVVLTNFIIVWFFLYIESRRFRFYTLLKERTRLIEKNLLRPLFVKDSPTAASWQEQLAESFANPRVKMSRVESIAWRLRRSYILIIPIIFLAWVVKIQTYPQIALSVQEAFVNAKLWFIPGEIVFFSFLICVVGTLAIGFYIPQTSHEDDLP